jgi:hypothetical protein
MTPNEIIIKLSGSASIDQPLQLGHSYTAGIEFSVSNEDHSNNDDGTYDEIFRAKLIRAIIQTETGKIQTKDKTHQSQKLRLAIIRSKPADSPLDEEAYYNAVMGSIRHYLDQIIDLINKEDDI